ncbi:TRAP transporter large permease [Antarctobacter sp.]|uniref:TRAP transporter large permease n=1 Tax=Antarctobacter sp. TaxID=1872577 RepID=UPI003A8D82FB
MVFLTGTMILIGFIAIGIPIGFALGLAGIAAMYMLVPTKVVLALMSGVAFETVNSYIIVTIPMFVLMAEFLSAGGVAQDLLIACNRLMRRVRGGMAVATVLAGAVLASASGSSTASAASMTRAAYPVMRKAGYANSLTIGTISVAGTLAVMIPPSVAFVLYGLMTESSIGKLFIAGVIPGILTAAGYILTIYLIIRRRPDLGPKKELEEKLSVQSGNGRVWPIGLLILVVLGGLYTGVATPTEISALGALGALIISTATRRMDGRSFILAIGNTLRTTAMIVTIIFSAHLFGNFISFTKITDSMLGWIVETGVSPTTVMLLVVLIYLIMGMIMDQAAIIILTVPITAPLMVGLGYDVIWWGVVIIKTVEIGLVSPPMGLNVFVASGAAKVNLREGFSGVIPFLAIEFVILGLLMAFPAISLWLVG